MQAGQCLHATAVPSKNGIQSQADENQIVDHFPCLSENQIAGHTNSPPLFHLSFTSSLWFVRSRTSTCWVHPRAAHQQVSLANFQTPEFHRWCAQGQLLAEDPSGVDVCFWSCTSCDWSKIAPAYQHRFCHLRSPQETKAGKRTLYFSVHCCQRRGF